MMQGSFSFAKSIYSFSRMAFDQVHGQNNKIISGHRGASGFLNLEDESAVIQWETCGPEVGRISCPFEEEMKDDFQCKNQVDNLSLAFNCLLTHKRIITVSTAWIVSKKFSIFNILVFSRFLENFSRKMINKFSR